ncbi:MAG: methyltransferase, partial [Actinomycetota bacterium]|nr:methyltransferase [Actinomycetota bacterium]
MTPLHTPAVVDALATDLRAAAYTTDGVAELLGADAGAFSRGLSWSALRATERAPDHQHQLAVLVRLLLLGTEES